MYTGLCGGRFLRAGTRCSSCRPESVADAAAVGAAAVVAAVAFADVAAAAVADDDEIVGDAGDAPLSISRGWWERPWPCS